jgi:hypothetical protein
MEGSAITNAKHSYQTMGNTNDIVLSHPANHCTNKSGTPTASTYTEFWTVGFSTLRRAIYLNGEFNVHMILAALSGSLLLFAFLAFFYNIVVSLGIKSVLGIYTPSKLNTKDPVTAQ